jgi:hypothetical protein
VRQALCPLFEQYGVNIVFNGHNHCYERSVANGVTYIVTGGGGAPLYTEVNESPDSFYFASVHHFVQITLSGGTLHGVAIEPDGTEFDHFTIVLDGVTLTATPTPMLTRTPTETATLTPTATGTSTATGKPAGASDDSFIYLPLIMKAYNSRD